MVSLLGSEKVRDMRELKFVNGEFYHIFDRGVDKRRIFDTDDDFLRFRDSLFLFNDANYAHSGDPFDKLVRLEAPDLYDSIRDPLLRIISYTLLPNHFHLYVQQLKDGGIPEFFHKVKKAYSWSYNRRNNRTGALFEGKYKARHINNEAYFRHIVPYIHLNVLDLTGDDWRGGKVRDWNSSLHFMDVYRWSSHTVFMGQDQDYPVIDPGAIQNFYRSPEEYITHLRDWSTRDASIHLESHLATE